MPGLWTLVFVSIAIVTIWPHQAWSASKADTPHQFTGAAESSRRPAGHHDSAQKVVYRLDFSDYAGGSVEEWLASKGFKFEEAAEDRNLLGLSVQNDALVLEAKAQIRGFLSMQSLNIEKFSTVRLEWGILKYPEGASYEQGVRNEALMVYIAFGHEKMPSGNILLPDLAYFIGLFLCKNDKLNMPYIGKYYQAGGRFVCLGHPHPAQTVVSEFDLVTAFRSYFEKNEAPPISGITLGVDTSDAGDGGRAAVYIRTIEFLQ